MYLGLIGIHIPRFIEVTVVWVVMGGVFVVIARIVIRGVAIVRVIIMGITIARIVIRGVTIARVVIGYGCLC